MREATPGRNGHERDRATAALPGTVGRTGEEHRTAGPRPERGRGRTRREQASDRRESALAGRASDLVFSDPHFEHEASIGIFDRPFRNRHHGDAYLLEHWTRDVHDDDTLICLGDVTMGRPTDGLIDRLRRRPGRKILVTGNHDHAHLRRLRRAFDMVAACAHLPGEPDLLLTHVPLDDVPPRLHQRPRPRPPAEVGGRVPDQRLRGADRVPADPDGRREETRPAPGSAAARRGRHDRHLHRLGEGLS